MKYRRILISGFIATALLHVPKNEVSARDDVQPIDALPPGGFDDLAAERLVVVDLYFGDRLLGAVEAIVTPSSIKFVAPESVSKLLPALREEAVIAERLTHSFKTNAAKLCSRVQRHAECGKLTPGAIELIFNEESFRADIFINPEYLAPATLEEREYLPPPTNKFSFINSVNALVSGEIGETSSAFLQDTLVASSGRERAIADFGYSERSGFFSETIAAEIDRHDIRYRAGQFWTRGDNFLTRRQIVGIALESQIDTRFDSQQFSGTPIIVFLPERARIEVFLGERLLVAQTSEAGNHEIETSRFPEGSYELEIVTTSIGGRRTSERRLFSKFGGLPPVGRTNFFAHAGFAERSYSDANDLQPTVSFGAEKRVTNTIALSASSEFFDNTSRFQVGGLVLFPGIVSEASAILEDSGRWGGLVRLSSTNSKLASFNIDFRHLEDGGTEQADVVASDRPIGPTLGPLDTLGFTQVTGSAAVGTKHLRMRVFGTYRTDRLSDDYQVGGDARYELLRRGRFGLGLEGSVSFTSVGHVAYAGLSLNFFGTRSSGSAFSGYRSTSDDLDGLGQGYMGTLALGYAKQFSNSDQLTLNVGGEKYAQRTAANASADYHARPATIRTDIGVQNGLGRSSTQYSVGFQSTLAGWGNGFDFVRQHGTLAAASILITERGRTDRFEILVDEHVRAEVSANEEVLLDLPAYRAFDIRIRPKNAGSMEYDGSSREISLYPGTVTRLEWEVQPTQIMFGRLLDSKNAPLSGAEIRWQRSFTYTDADGFFQVEGASGMEVLVKLSDQEANLQLPSHNPDQDIVDIGDLIVDWRSK